MKLNLKCYHPPPKLKQSLLVTNKLLKFILLDYRLKCIFFKDF